jgi:CRP/FNR family cyclic AMP-dependent transcriptional regulator
MVKADAAQRFLSAPLLDDVDQDSKQAVLDVLVEVRAKAGSILLRQGEQNDHLSFLIEGSATVERASPGRRKDVLAHLTAPAVFGTTSFFRPDPPTFTVRAATDVWMLTLDHAHHERLRRENPRAAEALAVATVRVLSEHFDMLDKRLTESMAHDADDVPKVTEWSRFRSRLFEEAGN